MQVMIGYAEYPCSCVKYLRPIDPRVIVGVSIAAALLILLLILLVFLLCRGRRRKHGPAVASTKFDDQHGSEMAEQREQYSRQLPDYTQTAANDTDTQYSQQLPGDYVA